jgi:coenzyme F420-reducing hydrogenase delta subunit
MSGAPVVVFSCQWSPHACFQSLYRRGRRGEAAGIRVVAACVGRVGEDLVLEAFRQGAAGVWVLGCPPDLCRHGLDRRRFDERIGALRRILGTLGIPAERLVVRSYHPHEAERLADELGGFAAALGEARP